MKKQLLLTLLLIGAPLGAYEWDFMNMTNEVVVLKFNTRKDPVTEDLYAVIPPGSSTKFPLKDAWCFLRASWDIWKEKDYFGNPIPYKGGWDLVTKSSEVFKVDKVAVNRIQGKIGGIDKQRIFGDKIAPSYAFSPMEVYMLPSSVFEKTVRAAEQLSQGLDKMACQTINEVKSFMGITTAENIGKGIGDGEKGTPEDKAKSDINQLISVLEEAQKIIEATDITKADQKAKGKISVQELFTADVTKKLQANTNLTGVKIGAIKQFTVNARAKSDALGYIAGALAVLRSKTKLDLDSSLVKTAMDTGMGTGTGSSPKVPLKDPEKCSFGLGEITAAAGKLAGITMCKPRQFIIEYVPSKEDPTEPEFYPFTTKPKLRLTTVLGE